MDIVNRKRDDAMTTMTPSRTMTDGQIGKIKEKLGEALRKAGLQSEPAQQVLETKGQGNLMIAEMVAVVRRFVEATSNQITRRVKVDRSRTPQEALDATGRKQHTNHRVVSAMPHGEGEEVEVVFFKLGRYISDADLEQEYDTRDLIPADPYSLAAVNEADPAFADTYPHGTHWQADGKWCFATFHRWGDDEREVNVDRYAHAWSVHWWFAGLRKSSGLES